MVLTAATNQGARAKEVKRDKEDRDLWMPHKVILKLMRGFLR